MSDSVDALLGGEEIGDYDLRDDEEDALLEDDSYEQSRVINSVQGDAIDESEDVLELNVEEMLNDEEDTLNDEDETDLNESQPTDDENYHRNKFASERVGNAPVPDTTTRPVRQQPGGGFQPAGPNNRNNRFPKRNGRGSFRGGRGRGGPRGGFQNGQNRNTKMRVEAWEKKPTAPIRPWASNQPVNSFQPPNLIMQLMPQQMQEAPFQQMQPPLPLQQMPLMNKPPVHQRLGFPNQHVSTFTRPPGPPVHFEQERQITLHPIQMPPPNYLPPQQQQQHHNQQYNPLPVFNHPPPPSPVHHYQPPPQPAFNPNHQHFNSPPPVAYHPQPQQFQHIPPQYHHPPEPPHHAPQIQQQLQQQPQVMFQNDHYQKFEPPQPVHDYQEYNHNAYTQMAPPPNYQRQVVMRNNQNRAPGTINNRTKKFVPNKRKEWKVDADNAEVKRRIFENKNLQEVHTVDTTTPQIESNVKLDEEDEETKRYRKGIEEQKRCREIILAQKEERRKIAAMKKLADDQYNAVKTPLELVGGGVPAQAPVFSSSNPNLRVINAQELPVKKSVFVGSGAVSQVEKAQMKSFLSNRKIFAKDNSLVDTPVVVVSNLAAGTTEVKLRKICNGVGDIQKFELSPKERQATIQFKSVASAHAFYKKYQRFMLDLSMIKVTLKPQ